MPAREGEQMLDKLATTFRRLIDQRRDAQKVGLVMKGGHQCFGGTGDDGENVVEVVCDTAGELADRIELLRLMKLALGLARRRDVVEDERRTADRA